MRDVNWLDFQSNRKDMVQSRVKVMNFGVHVIFQAGAQREVQLQPIMRIACTNCLAKAPWHLGLFLPQWAGDSTCGQYGRPIGRKRWLLYMELQWFVIQMQVKLRVAAQCRFFERRSCREQITKKSGSEGDYQQLQ
jgi:hypothetical protein